MSLPDAETRPGAPSTSLTDTPPPPRLLGLSEKLSELRAVVRTHSMRRIALIELLDDVVGHCVEWFGVPATAWCYSSDTSALHRVADAGPRLANRLAPDRRDLTAEAVAAAIAAPHLTYSADSRSDTPTPIDWLALPGDHSILEAPIVIGGRLLGSLRLADAEAPRGWPDPTIASLQELAAILAPALLALDQQAPSTTDQVDRLTCQLQQSQRLEVVGQLAGGVAHDFNNILTAVRGFTDMLIMQSVADSPQSDMLEEIRRATARGQDLTRQLLTFARRQLDQVESLEVGRAVTEMMPMLDRLTDRGIEIAVEAGREVAIEADPAQLQQVLLNLVVNARDALPNGGTIRVQVDSCHHVKLGPCAAISVRDNGVGIAPENSARIFDPFFTTKEIGKGTGLGLSTVYGIVTKAGGEVRVESELGNGTSFHVLWPTPRPKTQPPPPTSTTATARGESVLVVEDDQANLRMVKCALEQLGYQVCGAGSAEEALAVAGTEPLFDLLLTDVVMPGMGGRLLAEEMCAQRADLRVVFMSGFTNDEILRHGIERETVHFLPKPFALEDLARTLRDALDTRTTTMSPT